MCPRTRSPRWSPPGSAGSPRAGPRPCTRTISGRSSISMSFSPLTSSRPPAGSSLARHFPEQRHGRPHPPSQPGPDRAWTIISKRSRLARTARNHDLSSPDIVDDLSGKHDDRTSWRCMCKEIPDVDVDIRRFFRTIEGGETTDSIRQWPRATSPDDLYRCFGVSGTSPDRRTGRERTRCAHHAAQPHSSWRSPSR